MYNYFYTSQRQTSEPHSHLLAHRLLLEHIILLFLNWCDLQEHSTSLKTNSVAKQNISILSVRFTMWPGMHMVHVHMQVHTCMHPEHDKQETSLNMKGGRDSQNLRGQEILRSSNCTNEKKMLSSLNIGWRRGGVVL